MHIRILLIELTHCLKKITVQRRLCCTDINCSIFQTDQVAQIIFSLEELRTPGRNILVKCVPLRRQCHALLTSRKKPAPKIIFQIMYRPRHRRLTDLQHTGSLGQILILRYIIKCFVIFKIGFHTLCHHH